MMNNITIKLQENLAFTKYDYFFKLLSYLNNIYKTDREKINGVWYLVVVINQDNSSITEELLQSLLEDGAIIEGLSYYFTLPFNELYSKVPESFINSKRYIGGDKPYQDITESDFVLKTFEEYYLENNASIFTDETKNIVYLHSNPTGYTFSFKEFKDILLLPEVKILYHYISEKPDLYGYNLTIEEIQNVILNKPNM